jgi:hypothetical protein
MINNVNIKMHQIVLFLRNIAIHNLLIGLKEIRITF